MNNLKKKKEDRFRMLNKVYEKTQGDELALVNMWELGEELGFDQNTTEQTLQYLSGEGLIEFRALGGFLGITHYGVNQVEDALEHPDIETKYFPPINIIHINSMSHSQLQQGTIDSQQTFNISYESATTIKDFIKDVKSQLDVLPLDKQQKDDIGVDIMTVETQLTKANPNNAIVTESLKSIHNVLEGISSNAIAHGLIILLSRVLQ